MVSDDYQRHKSDALVSDYVSRTGQTKTVIENGKITNKALN